MNIVLDCERMKYPYTGLYTFCSQLAGAMTKTITDKDKLDIFVTSKNKGFLGNNYNYIKQRPFHRLLPVSASNADIWHTTYQLSEYTGGSRKTKKVMTVHDLNFLYEKSSASDISRYTKRYQKKLDKTDHIVAISEYVKTDILENLNVKDIPLTVIHNGYQITEYPDFDSPRYRPQVPYILAMGTVVRKKNFHVLPALLVDNDYELLIAGITSSYVHKVEEEARRHNVQDRVKILGTVSDEEKFWYLKNSLAFTFPSLAEGFGLPVMEAMHFGKPVFLSTLTSLPEIGGEQAYYFENFDSDYMQEIFRKSMQDYIDNKNKPELIKQHAACFSWANCAEKYYNVYQEVLSRF